MARRNRPDELARKARARLLDAAGSAAASASWMALVAATTLGAPSLQRVRAAVSLDSGEPPAGLADEFRLVVQSYSASNVVDGIPRAHARPFASAQRSVTPEELARGVAIDVVDVSNSEARPESVIVAWFERGTADLEFDARRARPGRDAYVGAAVTDGGGAQAHVVLSRKLA